MVVVLPGLRPAVLRAERLDPYGTAACGRPASEGITCMPPAVGKV